MWIKERKDPKAKWKRIRYHDWSNMLFQDKCDYEVKEEFAQTDKQKLAMLKGRIIRHTLATQAQAAIAKQHLAELIELERSHDPLSPTKKAYSELSYAAVFCQDAMESLNHLKAKQSSPSNLS